MSYAEVEEYSATVRAELHIGGQVLELAEIGPDHCVLRSPIAVPTGRGIILVSVDSEFQRTAVDVLDMRDLTEGVLSIRQLEWNAADGGERQMPLFGD